MASLINYLWGGKSSTSTTTATTNESTKRDEGVTSNDDEKYSSLSLSSLSSSVSSSASSDKLLECIVALSEVRFDNNGSGGRLLKPIPRAQSLLLSINRCGPFQYELCGSINNEIMFRHPINSSLIAYFSPAENSFVWLMPWPHHMTAIHAAFQSIDDEKKFNSVFTKVVYENSRQENYEKTVKEGDSKWIESAYRGGGDMDIDSDEESYSFGGRQSVPTKQLAPEFSDNDDDDDNNNSNNDTDDDEKGSSSSSSTAARLRSLSLGAKGSIRIKNEHLSVGLAQNRTFVARGHRLGVFRHEDGELNFITKTELKRLKGTTMTPMRVLLKERDTRVAMIDSNDNTKVIEMDVETGKIVSEYGGYADDMAIRNIGLTTKYEDLNNNPMVLGVNANSVFSLDPRQHGTNKIAQKQVYTVPTKNSCVTATKEGFVAVGSDKGEIRLYDSIDKRAKSMLPGLGDPIIGMDVTGDGKWLLATTKHYLLLIPTSLEDDTSNKNGFQKSISSKASPPIKLQLSTRDIIKNQISECTFSTAHFDINIDNEEEWIVASTGPFVVKWNFKKIKQSKNLEYTITRSVENVVDAVFLPGRADQVMIALPDNVYLEKLQKNTKRY